MRTTSLLGGLTLMGIDFLDLQFRIERRIGITISPEDLNDLVEHRHPPDFTAGALQFAIGARLSELGLPIPENLWEMICEDLGDVCGARPNSIKPSTWIIKDLGFT